MKADLVVRVTFQELFFAEGVRVRSSKTYSLRWNDYEFSPGFEPRRKDTICVPLDNKGYNQAFTVESREHTHEGKIIVHLREEELGYYPSNSANASIGKEVRSLLKHFIKQKNKKPKEKDPLKWVVTSCH
jgi:hypothetical protein